MSAVADLGGGPGGPGGGGGNGFGPVLKGGPAGGGGNPLAGRPKILGEGEMKTYIRHCMSGTSSDLLPSDRLDCIRQQCPYPQLCRCSSSLLRFPCSFPAGMALGLLDCDGAESTNSRTKFCLIPHLCCCTCESKILAHSV